MAQWKRFTAHLEMNYVNKITLLPHQKSHKMKKMKKKVDSVFLSMSSTTAIDEVLWSDNLTHTHGLHTLCSGVRTFSDT